jgi:hypothetical protein
LAAVPGSQRVSSHSTQLTKYQDPEEFCGYLVEGAEAFEEKWADALCFGLSVLQAQPFPDSKVVTARYQSDKSSASYSAIWPLNSAFWHLSMAQLIKESPESCYCSTGWKVLSKASG